LPQVKAGPTRVVRANHHKMLAPAADNGFDLSELPDAEPSEPSAAHETSIIW
jgi:hypothetical protein